MAFDGIMIAGLVHELKQELLEARITKIAQPEADQLLLTIKNSKKTKDGNTIRTQNRLVISANPSLPLLYLTDENKPAPLQAPTFCMVLRKHLNNCKITAITQIGLERVIRFDLVHLNEMGDYCNKSLYIELMGKHSNIIFCDDHGKIIDSIKHISVLTSSVREVLPGRDYFIPNTQSKKDPFTISKEVFFEEILTKPVSIEKALFSSLTGFSGAIAGELLYRASLSEKNSTLELTMSEKEHLYRNFTELLEEIRAENFSPQIIYTGDTPIEFSAISMQKYQNENSFSIKEFSSASNMLIAYYQTKERKSRIHQKSADLRKITQTALDRNLKKCALQKKQLKDTEKRERFKIYGELLTTYGYELSGGEKEYQCINFYTNEPVTIPLDPTKSALENAKHYFDKYAKQKRTFQALTVQLKETEEDIAYLTSISNALDIATEEADLIAIRNELKETGYVKKGTGNKKGRSNEKSKPLHYLSSDGFHMYVGKNNYQNDELTFKVATGNDWWFHAKQNAGSHVIVKTEGKELPDRTFEEAARLAAYYSKSRDQEKAEIDYIQKKHIKKPNGAKPGFVIYYTNYSMTISTDISGIQEIKDEPQSF